MKFLHSLLQVQQTNFTDLSVFCFFLRSIFSPSSIFFIVSIFNKHKLTFELCKALKKKRNTRVSSLFPRFCTETIEISIEFPS